VKEYTFPGMFNLITNIKCQVPFMKDFHKSYYDNKSFYKMFYDSNNLPFNLLNPSEAKYVKLTYNGIKLSNKDYNRFLASGITYSLKNNNISTNRIYLR